MSGWLTGSSQKSGVVAADNVPAVRLVVVRRPPVSSAIDEYFIPLYIRSVGDRVVAGGFYWQVLHFVDEFLVGGEHIPQQTQKEEEEDHE
jgi:hypothetical protein